jgi:hypothetical protein
MDFVKQFLVVISRSVLAASLGKEGRSPAAIRGHESGGGDRTIKVASSFFELLPITADTSRPDDLANKLSRFPGWKYR